MTKNNRRKKFDANVKAVAKVTAFCVQAFSKQQGKNRKGVKHEVKRQLKQEITCVFACCISCDDCGVATANPFRYRGYYLDNETGLWYLNSRYYDSVVGRFLSPDRIDYLDPETLGGLNLYSYCNNNPVNFYDPSGHFDWSIFAGWCLVALMAVASIALITVAVIGKVSTAGLLGNVFVGTGVGALISMVGSVFVQGGFKNADPYVVAKSGAIGGLIGAYAGFISWGFGQIGSELGTTFGYMLGKTPHIVSGIEFGKIFGTQILMKVGSFIFSTVGGIVGSTMANYVANSIFGNDIEGEDIYNQGIISELPMWVIKTFRWLLALRR